MSASFRLALFAIVGVSLSTSTCLAQSVTGGRVRLFGGPPASAEQIENHLRAYNRGTLNPGGYNAGYSHSGGYGFGGNYGATFGGGAFYPGYANYDGLYSTRLGYNFGGRGYGYGYGYGGPSPLNPRPMTYPLTNPSTASGFPMLPPAAVAPPAADVQFQPRGASPAIPPQPIVSPNVATIQVLLPDPAAKVQLGDQPTTSLGRERTFYSPPLEAGGKYAYIVIATWTQNGAVMRDARTAIIAPGEMTFIDFTRPENADTASPPAKIDPGVDAAPL